MCGFTQEERLCSSMKQLIQLFSNCCFTVLKQELRDWHFNEFEITMEGTCADLPDKIPIPSIEQYNKYTYICNCHWSTLRIVCKDEPKSEVCIRPRPEAQ